MRRIMLAAALLALTAQVDARPATPPQPNAEDAAQQASIDQAVAAIGAGKAADALAPLDRVIAENDKRYAGEKRQVYAARTMAETLLYLTGAAGKRTDAIVVGRGWGTALFLKGYALVDLGRSDEAGAWFERAITLSPMNAQYLGEYGEWYKGRREWDKAYALFERAASAAEVSPDEARSHDRRRGLRGMGYVLIERGRLDEAEARFRECLAIDPTDAGAQRELDYIRQHRERPKTPAA